MCFCEISYLCVHPLSNKFYLVANVYDQDLRDVEKVVD